MRQYCGATGSRTGTKKCREPKPSAIRERRQRSYHSRHLFWLAYSPPIADGAAQFVALAWAILAYVAWVKCMGEFQHIVRNCVCPGNGQQNIEAARPNAANLQICAYLIAFAGRARAGEWLL